MPYAPLYLVRVLQKPLAGQYNDMPNPLKKHSGLLNEMTVAVLRMTRITATTHKYYIEQF